MKLRNKKTGDIGEFNYAERAVYDAIILTVMIDDDPMMFRYDTLAELNEGWEDYEPKEPLIKDEKIRKAVRAWAEANGFSVFRVNNQHFNSCKIHGVKDRYSPNGSSIEFLGTIAGAEKITYAIEELCGEEE